MKIFNILFLLLTLEAVTPTITLPLGDYIFWIFFDIVFLVFIIVLKFKYFDIKNDLVLIWPVKLFLFWNVICITRGFFIASNYWEWKNLVTTATVMFIPLIIYIATNKNLVQQIIHYWLKYAFILFFLLIPYVLYNDFYGAYLVPVMFLVLFFSILPIKWKIIVLFFVLLVLAFGADSRSNFIKFSIAGFLGSLYYFKFFIKKYMFKIMHILFMSLPIVLLCLGLLNIFNVFKINKYVGNYNMTSDSGAKIHQESLTVDTRTFIYVETITSAIKNNYIIEGRTPALGYDSKYFGSYTKWNLGTGKAMRFASEVSILNIFTWNGFIGVILYFLVFYIATYLAVYKSNSFHMKIVGIFVAFRWSYAFVEDFTSFGLPYVFLWILIGMCYSTSFRKMNDAEFAEWVRALLPKVVFK